MWTALNLLGGLLIMTRVHHSTFPQIGMFANIMNDRCTSMSLLCFLGLAALFVVF